MLIRVPYPTSPAKTLATACLVFSTAMACNAQNAAVYDGVTGGEWATGSNWTNSSAGNNSYPSDDDFGNLDTTANVSIETPNNIRAIRIGTNGTGTLQVGSNAELRATATPGRTSYIGDGSGNSGTVKQEGGNVELNVVEIGRNNSTGLYHIHTGDFSVIRGQSGFSMFIGTDSSNTQNGNGTFRISSGNFTTRTGVRLGSPSGGIGRFEVIGSHPSLIGIGSNNGIDGSWVQNAGSTLSVRIDKTLKGVTPVFIDDVDADDSGDGDVTFENGALLDVDFTAAFHNGGTFTVMEWEGDLINRGLRFAPTVDTNIWSFQVDAANKRLTVTATGNPISRNFVHPGLSHKLSDLERMRDMVAAGIEPYATTFQQLSSHPRAQFDVQPGDSPSYTVLGDGSNGGVNNNNFLRNDAISAYYNALMWMLTGDSRHADAAIRIFTVWSALRRNETNLPLDTGRHWRLFEAAEIIQSTYDGWDPDDLQAFKDMIVFPGYSNTSAPTNSINRGDITFYWACYQGDSRRHGNQGLFCMRTVMAMGVFLDNEIMYDRALRYLQGAPAREDDLSYPSGPPNLSNVIFQNEFFIERSQNSLRNDVDDYGYNEVVHNLIYPNGQGQESSRDQSHGLTGPGIIATMSEIAWSQGDDLYGHLDNRLLKGLEFYYHYNLSLNNAFDDQEEPTPFEPTIETGEFIQRSDRTGRYFSLAVNPFTARETEPEDFERARHNLEPGYEMYLAHFRDRMDVPSDDHKWLTRGLDLLTAAIGVEPEGTIGDFATRGGLTFHRVTPGDPIRGFNNGAPDFAMNSLPSTIQAENYDYFPVDGEGHTYSDNTPANSGVSYRLADAVDISAASEGGFAISDIEAGEWVTYTVSPPATGTYDISIRYASTTPGGTIQFSFDGSDTTGQVTIPNGGSASTGASDWQDLVIATNVPLDQGVQPLRISFGGTSDSFLLNSFTIDRDSSILLGQWNFNEGSGTIARDSSGNGNDGTISNATYIQSEGRRGLDFNGTSSTVQIPGAAFTGIDDQVSIAMWTFGDTSLPANASAFYAHTTRNARVLNVLLPFGNSQIFWDAPDRISRDATEDEYEGSWTHWVFTKNATSGIMNIYRNGEIWHTGTNRFASIDTIGGARIGSALGNSFYNGMIDEVQLYNVALSGSEVSTLFEDSTIFGLVGDAQFSTTKSNTPPTISSTDLAQTEFVRTSATGGTDIRNRGAELFNGTIGNGDGDTNDSGEVRTSSADTITIELDTSVNTLGYDISGITTVFGWNTAANGRSNQGYGITLNFADGTTDTLVSPTHWEPNDPAFFYTTVSFAPSVGSRMASGVESITFDISEDANARGFVVAREFDIFGTPTIAPDDAEVIAVSAIDDWRILNFGSANTSLAADGEDPDKDGLPNLLEYAIGQDPNAPSSEPAIIIGHSPEIAGELEVSYNTIADPTLTYELQGSETLTGISWITLTTTTGEADETIVFPESAWPDTTLYFFRLQVSY